jgi:hypothetical protein
VISLEVVMANSRVETIGRMHESLCAERAEIENLIRARSAEMARALAAGLDKTLARLLALKGSCVRPMTSRIFSRAAKERSLRFSPPNSRFRRSPDEKGLGLVFFSSVDEAMQATVEASRS